jgi:hypothetical protein
MNATTPPTAPHPRPAAPWVIVTYQVTPPLQPRGFPPAVLRAVAHHPQEQLTTQVPRLLPDCPAPRGAHSTGALHPLVVDITNSHLTARPSPAAVPPLPVLCCDIGWAVDHAQPWDTRHARWGWGWTADLWGWRRPTRGSGCGHCIECATNPHANAGLTGPGELRFRAGMTPSPTVSQPHGDRQGRSRSPPARVVLLSAFGPAVGPCT